MENEQMKERLREFLGGILEIPNAKSIVLIVANNEKKKEFVVGAATTVLGLMELAKHRMLLRCVDQEDKEDHKNPIA